MGGVLRRAAQMLSMLCTGSSIRSPSRLPLSHAGGFGIAASLTLSEAIGGPPAIGAASARQDVARTVGNTRSVSGFRFREVAVRTHKI
jgi:hypothetical protein